MQLQPTTTTTAAAATSEVQHRRLLPQTNFLQLPLGTLTLKNIFNVKQSVRKNNQQINQPSQTFK